MVMVAAAVVVVLVVRVLLASDSAWRLVPRICLWLLTICDVADSRQSQWPALPVRSKA